MPWIELMMFPFVVDLVTFRVRFVVVLVFPLVLAVVVNLVRFRVRFVVVLMSPLVLAVVVECGGCNWDVVVLAVVIVVGGFAE